MVCFQPEDLFHMQEKVLDICITKYLNVYVSRRKPVFKQNLIFGYCLTSPSVSWGKQ